MQPELLMGLTWLLRRAESWRLSGETSTLTYRESQLHFMWTGHLVLSLAKQRSLCQQGLAL